MVTCVKCGMKKVVNIAKSEWVIISAFLFLALVWAIAFEYVFDTGAPGVN
jgi:hypothetical protein